MPKSTRELDRLSRNLAKQLIVEESLKRAGAEIEYALGEYPDTPEGRLNKHIRATIAEYEREKIVERMVRGQRNAVKAGSVLVSGNPPYGYRVEKDEDRLVLVVYEPEAKVVRLIYLWYTQGDGERGPLGIKTIARKLEGAPTFADSHGRRRTRGPGKWGASTVSDILGNETYAGVWHYGKRPRATGRQKCDTSTLLAVEVPAIIDRELWEKAQARKAAMRANSPRNVQREYLLGRRVTCGFCGLKMAGCGVVSRGKPYLYYRCFAEPGGGVGIRECNLPMFRADWVDTKVWEWVKELLTDPEAFERGLRKHQAERDKANKPIRARLVVVDDLWAENRKQLDRLLDLYLSGDFPREVLTDRKTRLETTISALEEERADLAAHLDAGALSEGQIKTVQEFVAKVGAGIDVGNTDFQTRRGVIDALDVRARLCVEDGVKVVRVSAIVHPEEDVLSYDHNNLLRRTSKSEKKHSTASSKVIW